MAKKMWTSAGAIQTINNDGDNEVMGNVIHISKNGFKGLATCSAYDFLVGKCGFKTVHKSK